MEIMKFFKKISEDNQDILECGFKPCFLKKSAGIVRESRTNIIDGECQITQVQIVHLVITHAIYL